MFYGFLKNGKKITISDPKGVYTTTKFYCRKGTQEVRYDNAEIGFNCVHKNFTLKPITFNRHIKQMISENLTITIE